MSVFKNNLSGEVCKGTGNKVGGLVVVEVGAECLGVHSCCSLHLHLFKKHHKVKNNPCTPDFWKKFVPHQSSPLLRAEVRAQATLGVLPQSYAVGAGGIVIVSVLLVMLRGGRRLA